jgi:uncharacterized protein (DUF2141 family)
LAIGRCTLIASVMLAVGLSAQTRAVAGTGRIDGRVVLIDDGAVVRRAVVTISGGEMPRSRSVITDDTGAFVFTNLPSGRFTLTAARPAFIPSSYGARAPGRPGTRISLATGQHLTDVVVRMARGAVISGTVRNEIGEPMPNVTVAFSGTQPIDTRSGLSTIDLDCDNHCGSVITDDRGTYRAFGLPAGSYIVGAFYDVRARIEMVKTAEVDAAFAEAQRTLGRPGAPASPSIGRGGGTTGRPSTASRSEYSYAAVFHPGTADAAAAQRITVAFGEERSGIDIVLAPTPTVTVEGTIVNPAGPLPRLTIDMTPHNTVPIPDDLQPDPGTARAPVTHPAPSGDFQFSRVTPGRYTITARAVAGQVVAGPDGSIVRITSDGPAPPPLWASADVVVTGGDVSGVHLTLRPAFRVTGRIQFEGTSPVPADLANVSVGLSRVTGTPAESNAINLAAFRGLPVPNTTARADGRFEMAPVYPGFYRIAAGVPGPVWRLRSAMVGGRDLLDDALVINPEAQEDITGVVLTYTERRTQVTGTLQTPAGAPATEYFIVVFTAERRWWRPDGRRVAFSRPATDGQFVVRDLPPGEYYIAALTDLDTGSWQSPEFLDQVVPGSLRFTLAEGETQTQDLRIAQA